MIDQTENHIAITLFSKAESIREHITTVQSQPPKKHETEQSLSKGEIQAAVDGLNKQLIATDAQLKFVYHEQLNEYYVTVVNATTDEVIREIPSKKLMDIHAAMREYIGLFVDRKI